eukprot:scaffold6208_cov64-Phaeocystis_antarctica.AAC.6
MVRYGVSPSSVNSARASRPAYRHGAAATRRAGRPLSAALKAGTRKSVTRERKSMQRSAAGVAPRRRAGVASGGKFLGRPSGGCGNQADLGPPGMTLALCILVRWCRNHPCKFARVVLIKRTTNQRWRV